MDEDLRLRTYRKVWRMERVIYQIERVRLPFPVSFRQVGIFAAAAALLALLSAVQLIGAAPPALRYVLLPGLAAWYLSRQTLDGRAPHLWLRSLVRFWLSPRRLRRLQPLPAGGRRRYRLWIRLPRA